MRPIASWGRAGVVCLAGAILTTLPGATGAAPREDEPPNDATAPSGPWRGITTPSDVHHYVLHPIGDGSYLFETPGFKASIAIDGTVEFHEPAWTPRSRIGEIISGGGKGRRPEEWPIPTPTDDRPTPYDQRERSLNSLTPLIPLGEPIFIDAGMRFDLTDSYARQFGEDPYRTAKASFLADTFDFRMKLAARQHRRDTDAALADLRRELEAIWRDDRFNAAERGHILYLLWQETADDPPGIQARGIIQGFARDNLPPDQAARFNRAPPTTTPPTTSQGVRE